MTPRSLTAAARPLSILSAILLGEPAFAGSSEFAGWDLFTCPDPTCAPNVPDVAGSTNGDATVEQQVPGAIITSGSNIYHPSAASFFVLRDDAASALSFVQLLLRVDGAPLDLSSVVLRFGSEARMPTVSGSGGQWTFDWDLTSDDVTSYTIEWEATSAHMSLDGIDLTTVEGGSLGTQYCTSTTNATGSAATIEASGSAVIADDMLLLTASSVPNQPGIFFVGNHPGQVPFGNGHLCTVGGIQRGAIVHPTAQTVTYQWPTMNLSPGTRYFQYWFFDPQGGGASFNTSDGVAITLL